MFVNKIEDMGGNKYRLTTKSGRSVILTGEQLKKDVVHLDEYTRVLKNDDGMWLDKSAHEVGYYANERGASWNNVFFAEAGDEIDGWVLDQDGYVVVECSSGFASDGGLCWNTARSFAGRFDTFEEALEYAS